ncbi:MAG: DUF433 domain-containing protein [Acidobacteriota bacterium]
MAVQFSQAFEKQLMELVSTTGRAPEALLADALAGYASPDVAALAWSQCPAVESVPGKVSGAWVLRGTRMPVATIFEALEEGANIDDILQWYDGLDREQVRAVVEFAARSLEPGSRSR